MHYLISYFSLSSLTISARRFLKHFFITSAPAWDNSCLPVSTAVLTHQAENKVTVLAVRSGITDISHDIMCWYLCNGTGRGKHGNSPHLRTAWHEWLDISLCILSLLTSTQHTAWPPACRSETLGCELTRFALTESYQHPPPHKPHYNEQMKLLVTHSDVDIGTYRNAFTSGQNTCMTFWLTRRDVNEPGS